MWILFIVIMVASEGVADVLAKHWSLNQNWSRFAAAIGAYIITNVFWLVALRGGSGLTRGAVLFSVGSAVLAIIIGLVLYKEPITKMQLLGMAFGVVAVSLMVWEP